MRKPVLSVGLALVSLSVLSASTTLLISGSPIQARAYHSGYCAADSYINSRGHCVHRPMASSSVPSGATAQCSDGTYSFSQSRRGTCSHHGGVGRWL